MLDKIFSGISIFLLAFIAFGIGIFLVNNSSESREIVLNNVKGTVKMVPNIAKVHLSVAYENTESSAKAQENVSQTIKKLSAIFEKYTISEADIITKNIRTNAYVTHPEEGDAVTVFSAHTDIQVFLSRENYTKISELLDEIIALQGIEVRSVERGFEKSEELYVEAQKNALQNAKQQAEEIAKEAGVTIKKIRHIALSSGSEMGFEKMLFANAADTAKGEDNFFKGEEEIVVGIDVIFAIK